MKIYKISQSVNTGYDTYDSAIVCAESEEEAKTIHPSDYGKYEVIDGCFTNSFYLDWAVNVSDVNVEYLGEAKKGLEKGVICASFNAG